MDVGNASILTLVDKRRASDVIPHLSGYHRKAENDRQEAPHLLVVQKVQVVPTQIQEPSDEGRQHENGHRGRVVRWSEDSDLNVRTLLDPLADNFSRHSNALDIHGIGRFRFALGREVDEHRGRIQAQHLEHVRALVEVHHRKEQLIRVGLRVPIGIGHYRVLVVGMPTDDTLPGRCHGREHNHHRVVSRCRFDKVPETVPIEAHDWPLGIHVQQLLNFLR